MARNWDSFEIDGYLYAAVACNADQSPVFKFTAPDVVQEFQQIPVQNVFGVKSVFVGKQLFLVYNSYHGPTSQIFRWHNVKKKFVSHQTVNAFGSGLETFTIAGRVFLAFTGKYNIIF